MTEADTYMVVRMYRDSDQREVIKRGLTLDEAREHCRDPETSASTATSAEAQALTAERGPWFDGYESENEAERNATEYATRAVVTWAINDEASYAWWCGMARRYAGDLEGLAEALARDLPSAVHVGDLGPEDWPSVDWARVAAFCAEDADS